MKKNKIIVISILFILLAISFVNANTIINNNGGIFNTLDSILEFKGNGSVLGTNSGGIKFEQTIPEAKSGIYWTAWDNASLTNRIVGWISCHYNSSINPSIHSHCSWETLDNTTGTPSVNSHLIIDYGSTLTKSNVRVASANFIINDLAEFNRGGKIKFTPDTDFEVYPNDQNSIALRVSNTSGAISLAGLGTDHIYLQDNITIPNLNGIGNAYACINSNGQIYRSGSACV
jgi:hypothetical protein